jgi:hypothetical protein
MSKISNALIILILLVVAGYFTQDYWMPMIAPAQEVVIEEVIPEEPELSCITITSPQPNATVTFPLTITATIDYGCRVIFEAQAGVAGLLQNSQIVSPVGLLTVTGDYYDQASYPVTAQATIASSTAVSWAVELVITPENPCGNDPECPAVPDPIVIPVVIQ